DWFDALFACQKIKLCLADFDTKEAFEDAKTKMQITDEYWVGLNSYEKNTFHYVSTNKGVDYIPPKTELNLAKPCGYLKPAFNDLTFGTDKCLRRRRYVCSSAESCNGIGSDDKSSSKASLEVPCDMSDDIKDILGI
ncbi:hypothetical protein KR093_004799, partial [Drosophila rubida]